VRSDTARLLLGAAREARERENFSQAREFVSKGRALFPGLTNFADESEAIAAAEIAFEDDRAEKERLARIESLKSEFAERADAGDVEAARALLGEIQRLGLRTDDVFLAQEAPHRLAEAYAQLASAAAAREDFGTAVAFQRQAVRLDTADADKAARFAGYRLQALFDGLEPVDPAQLERGLGAVAATFPDRVPALEASLVRLRASRLREYAADPAVDAAQLAARALEFEQLFPRTGTPIAGELAERVEALLLETSLRDPARVTATGEALAALRELAPRRYASVSDTLGARALAAIDALETWDPPAAATLLAAARRAFPEYGPLQERPAIEIPNPRLTTGREQLQRGELEAAARSLAAARRLDATHPDIALLASRLAARRRRAEAAYSLHVRLAEEPLGASRQGEIDAAFAEARSLCRDCGFAQRTPSPLPAWLCHAGKAGLGVERRGECQDPLSRSGSRRGPVLVVVPPIGSGSEPFAIGKFEISRREFADFCSRAGSCREVATTRPGLPVTDLSAGEIEAYARWLSEQASGAVGRPVTYRLPTAAEWEHAAKADGSQRGRDFNCRVIADGSPIAGIALLDARTGKPNGWGLTNHVGNARELVRAGNGLEARGGSFPMPLTRCGVSVAEPHDGSADALTGFRLVRSMR
jgi:hypothetical protein